MGMVSLPWPKLVQDHTCLAETIGVYVASPSSKSVLSALTLYQEDHEHPTPTESPYLVVHMKSFQNYGNIKT